MLESGEPREVQHFALLLGYGANAINPYLALETVRHLVSRGDVKVDADQACYNFLKANLNGVIKTMSKMGISTVASYRGAQIFEAIGINESVIDKYFTKTASRVEGIGLGTIAKETMARHDKAFAPRDDKRGDDLDPAVSTNGVLEANAIYLTRSLFTSFRRRHAWVILRYLKNTHK